MIYTENAGRTKGWRIPLLILACLLVFTLSLCFYSRFLSGEEFQDELDVFILGSEVAYGADMYSTTVSQHMPFSYYIAALITLLVHPHNAYLYRFCFYVLLSLLWTGIFFRYRKHINPFALFLLPLFYTSVLGFYENGSMMISEHWAGMGHVILLLEMILYIRTKRLTWPSCIWISGAILLSFGSVFTSAYSIAVVALGVFLYQIWLCTFGTEKEKRRDMRRQILKDDGRLLLCVLLPWAVLIGWYALKGSLADAIYSVYTLNVEIYSKYTGGLGTDPLGTFLDCVPKFIDLLVSSFKAVFAGDFSTETIASLLYTFCPVAVALYLCFKQPIIGIAYFLATTCITVRGFNNFHALHFICAASLSICLLLGAGLYLPFKHWKNPLSYLAFAAGGFMFYLFLSPTAPSAARAYETYTQANLLAHNTEVKVFTDIVTDPGDRIHYTDYYTTPIDVERPIDYGAACSTPWSWEGMGEKEIQALSDNETKVVFYEEGYGVWGEDRDTYAAALVQVLKEDYFPMSRTTYVRKTYLNEAIRRMIRAGFDTYLEFYDATPLTGEEKTGSVSLREQESQGIRTGFTLVPDEDFLMELVEFWPEKNGSLPFADLKLTVTDTATGEVMGEQTTRGSYFCEGEMNLFYFNNLVLREGTSYEFTYSLSGEGDICLMTAEDTEDSLSAAAMPGSAQDGQMVRLAVETCDPSYALHAEEEEEYGNDEEYSEAYAEEYSEESDPYADSWDPYADDPFAGYTEEEDASSGMGLDSMFDPFEGWVEEEEVEGGV